MKKIYFFFIISMLLFFTGCGIKNSKDDVIKIAVVAPMTGDNAEYGIGFKNAAELMAKKWNDNGGVLGKQIVIESYDDKNSREEAISIAQKIVSNNSYAGVIGHFSSDVCMVVSPIYQSYELVNISPSASHPDFSKEGDYIFRNNTIIYLEAETGVKLALEFLGKKKVGILSIRTDWGTSTAEITKELVEKMGGEVVAHEEVIEGDNNYISSISKLNNAGADVIIVVGMYNTLAPFARQYKAINPDIEIVGFANAYSEQLLVLGGEAVEGVVFPTVFFHNSERDDIKNFVSEYEAAYNLIPSSLTAQAYDSVGILLEAIKEAGSLDKKAIRDAVANMEYNGITGYTKFDSIGDAQKTFTRLIIKDGKFVEIE